LRDNARTARSDLTAAYLWDVSAVGAPEDLVSKLRQHGIGVELVALNAACSIPVDRHAPLV
jgi:sulfate permease, SulP family